MGGSLCFSFPPSCEPWNVSLVLDILQVSPFELLREISPYFFLLEGHILSGPESPISLSSTRTGWSCALLCHPSQKVVSAFHVDENIVLPLFCLSPSHPRERSCTAWMWSELSTLPGHSTIQMIRFLLWRVSARVRRPTGFHCQVDSVCNTGSLLVDIFTSGLPLTPREQSELLGW